MPPARIMVPRFAAEPSQEPFPYGRWEDTLRQRFLTACLDVDTEGEELGEAGDVIWYPERLWHGRTWIPATCRTGHGFELFGCLSFARDQHGQAQDLRATADVTSETSEANPEWTLDLCEEVIGQWRAPDGVTAAMTLVWGAPLVEGGVVATADLGDITVDQCDLIENRFTLIAPDDFRGEWLSVGLYDRKGRQLARESLYDEDDEPATEEE
jgi:hypothetical protein